MGKIQNELYIEVNKPFQLLPDYSLLMLKEQGQLNVYLPEADMFVGVSKQMENGFARRRKNILRNSVNYISVEDWKAERLAPKG